MTGHDHPGAQRPDAGADPTAEWLAQVRPPDTPWRVDRPPEAAAERPPAGEQGADPVKWRRARAAARAVGQAAPYVQAGALVGWAASAAFAEDGADGTAAGQPGFDLGAEG
ncbi:hypothetical protein [Amycolatopsis aidingensis]|uniref:hypothetical protein n=1 Tax=Amycolatopsis aidingensis TaxID=2842453 RepID=UPI001C0C2441|nr:hypothetical protein [Amycolatopsis aidingensis]